MNRQANKTSTAVSMALTILLTLLLTLLLPWVPAVVRSMLDTADHIGNRELLSGGARLYVFIAAYAMIAVAYVTLSLLFCLLREVRLGRVFERCVLRLLTLLSICCFVMGGLFLSILYCFQLAAIVAFAAFFLGLCLCVVKNVLAEAGLIKTENDFTI